MYLGRCKINLDAISNEKYVFGDETFTYAPKRLFNYIYITFLKNNYYIPLVYCFLHNKQTSSFLMLWGMLEKLCVQLTNKLQLNIFHANFKKDSNNAVLRNFQNCALVFFCNFHVTQN